MAAAIQEKVTRITFTSSADAAAQIPVGVNGMDAQYHVVGPIQPLESPSLATDSAQIGAPVNTRRHPFSVSAAS